MSRVLCPIPPWLEASWAARGGLGWQRCFKERAAVQEGTPPAGCRGGIIPYSVTQRFGRASHLQLPSELIKPVGEPALW